MSERERRASHHGYDPQAYLESERRAANEASRNRADHHGEEWTYDEDQFIWAEWIGTRPADRDEATIAEILGRTITACAVRASNLVNGTARSVAKRTRTVTTTEGSTEVTETTEYTRAPRPKWMDEEGLPDWYV